MRTSGDKRSKRAKRPAARKARGSAKLFLGFDSSTQGLKTVAITDDLRLAGEWAVQYDRDLPAFHTQGGVHAHADRKTVTAPPLMWVEALDLLLGRMAKAGFSFGAVAALSGSGQQHGSVWLRAEAAATLRDLDPARTLGQQLRCGFSLAASPIWMDASTREQCETLEEMLGGPQAVADLTGSRAYERFTGNQIAKIYQRDPDLYDNTDRIALVSSFMTSLFIGGYAPIDFSDGSGMNLLDIRRRVWASPALDCTAPSLEVRLGAPAASHTCAGHVHPYFARRYGFRRDCAVILFSGDNPCSLAGLRLQRPGDVAVSLGTSDTVFGSLASPRPSAREGHVFVSPVDPETYMAMICYRNGSLAREHVRDACAEGSWEKFEALAGETPPGNGGRIGFYFVEPEITPTVAEPGSHRFDARGRRTSSFPAAAEVRAVMEGQFLSMRLHGANVGLNPRAILATGGASVNRSLIRIMANVFGVSVFTGEVPNSAALGASYRALHGWTCARRRRFVPFADQMKAAPAFQLAARPDREAHAVYTDMLARYAELEQRIIGA
jgi:xylulokinase